MQVLIDENRPYIVRAPGHLLGPTWQLTTTPVGPVLSVTMTKYKCPKPDCPPTEFKPVYVETTNEGPRWLCAGCDGVFPGSQFTPRLGNPRA